MLFGTVCAVCLVIVRKPGTVIRAGATEAPAVVRDASAGIPLTRICFGTLVRSLTGGGATGCIRVGRLRVAKAVVVNAMVRSTDIIRDSYARMGGEHITALTPVRFSSAIRLAVTLRSTYFTIGLASACGVVRRDCVERVAVVAPLIAN